MLNPDRRIEMRSIAQLIASMFTRRTLGFMIFAGLAIAAWLFGGELAIDGLRPLAMDAARISCAMLLALTAGVWLFSGPMSIVAVAGAMLLVWHAGPWISFGNVRPLETSWIRVLLLGALAFVCTLYWIGRLLRAMREDEAFLSSILAIGRRHDRHEPAEEQLKDVAGTVRRALAQLKTLRLNDGIWGRIVERHRYLYELPWYLVIGSSGAGKTTALRNAGLQVPSSTGTDLRRHEHRNAPDTGTENCDWWFHNEAVLIDTAGRYSTQDSDRIRDPAEWRGFLRLLRKHRTRVPINGAIVVLSMAELLQMTPTERAEHAVRLRDRLAEMRQQLEIRFPVYVLVTKMDVLRGFEPYFHPLTSDARAQAWGFALSCATGEVIEPVTSADVPTDEVGEGLRRLEQRLADGLRARVSEEFDTERRRTLYALPAEFSAAAGVLREVLDPMVLDSRFDITRSSAMLRGVYFTSAAQAEVEVPADSQTLLQRLRRTTDAVRAGEPVDTRPVRAGHGFFIHDVLRKAIFPEAHLARPNLRWESRYRAMRVAGHLAVLALAACAAAALTSSYANNRDYLSALGQRIDALTALMRARTDVPGPKAISELLDAARALPVQAGLDVAAPPVNFRYGLYSVSSVADAASHAYAGLQATLLLPPIIGRMEQVLSQALRTGDRRSAYEALRAYKLLHDPKRYVEGSGADTVRGWLRSDARSAADDARSGVHDRTGTAEIAGRASLESHFDALFSSRRVLQASSPPDESLMRAVRLMLDGDSLTQRLYERTKLAMQAEAPPEFTLIRAVGPQVGTVFVRKDGRSLDQGVPGLFTYDGYHRIFAPRVAAMVRKVLDEDLWVMARNGSESVAAGPVGPADIWTTHVRQQYLNEFAHRWEDFHGSIRTIGSTDAPVESGGLGVELGVLRQLASPDSPLSRLGRASVRETTLVRQVVDLPEEKRSFLDRTAAAFATGSPQAGSAVDPMVRRLEEELVDNRFAALREVVTGSTGGRAGLDAIGGLLNDFYTWMVVADTALSGGSLPPGGADAAARLRLEAGRLPAPFKAVLAGVAEISGVKVTQGASAILRRQAQVQVDRLAALLATQVSEPCKRGLEGRYPFVAVAQEASIDDFTQMFSSGGVLDDYFSKYLATLVDTSTRPWRYRSADSVASQAALDASASSAATLAVPAVPGVQTGPTLLGEMVGLLARDGPKLEPFQRARQIRELFFRESGGKKMAWKMELTVRELEPAITELMMDIDGQSQRYVHGPLQPLSVTWPGPRGGAGAEITAQPRVSAGSSTLLAQGPWALFRLLDKGRVSETATPGRLSIEFQFDGRKALIELGTGSQPNPLNSDLLKGFRCPGRAA